jgi:mannonate dehydratase
LQGRLPSVKHDRCQSPSIELDAVLGGARGAEMKLCMVAIPPTDEKLATIRQIGVENLVHYDMCSEPTKYGRLEDFLGWAKRYDLAVPVIEGGPPIDRIVLGKDGWEQQTENWIQSLKFFGRLGVEVVCYNFMPQISGDAMVVRTDTQARTRGGAITTAYRARDLTPWSVPHSENPISLELVQNNLARFLRAVIPVAEDVGVKLAMHPDDPPMTPICGLQRTMSSVADFEWLVDLHPSPMNGVTLCAGCFAEMGEDVTEIAMRFRKHIHFVHIRNIKGCPEDFIETFPDDGDINLANLIRRLYHAGFEGYLRPDHAPLLASEPKGMEGYGFQGHLFTLGYLRGLVDAVLSENNVNAPAR